MNGLRLFNITGSSSIQWILVVEQLYIGKVGKFCNDANNIFYEFKTCILFVSQSTSSWKKHPVASLTLNFV